MIISYRADVPRVISKKQIYEICKMVSELDDPYWCLLTNMRRERDGVSLNFVEIKDRTTGFRFTLNLDLWEILR